MRLKSIKLAGFKSFVDATTVDFPSNLCGVVGPNGCGKSNVIDAVRWVMGESSAKQLRGDSMTDVIFNGSNTRKPVNQASIELVFDNSSGRISGEYAGFNEISIKRIVDRESRSEYQLNGSKCRRRDITDIFLGTGLGPRSYSIIEQGMISSLIMAKPEELRVYLEEAAGISKYKERRRDTENRVRRTRENLERLFDIREELGRQLQRLERQAQAAHKYREYQTQEGQLQIELLALRWHELYVLAKDSQGMITESEIELERFIAKDLSNHANIEQLREQAAEATDAFNEIQSTFYQVGADISRLEQSIQHHEQRQQQMKQDLSRIQQALQESQYHLDQDQARQQAIILELEEVSAKIMMQEDEYSAEYELKMMAQQKMDDWQERWNDFTEQAQGPKQQVEIEQANIRQRQQSLEQLTVRIERLKTQQQESVDLAELKQQLNQYAEQLQQDESLLSARKMELVTEESDLEEQQQQAEHIRAKLASNNREHNELLGKVTGLETLQQAAEGDDNQALETFVEQNELSSMSRLSQTITVEPGWETAVETLLSGQNLNALCLPESMGLLSDQLIQDQPAGLALRQQASYANTIIQAESILHKIQGASWVPELAMVLAYDDLSEAFARRKTLTAEQSIITPEGIWLGANWIRIPAKLLSSDGSLKRHREITELKSRIEKSLISEREYTAQLGKCLEVIEDLTLRVKNSRQQIEQLQAQKLALTSQQSAAKATLIAAEQKNERLIIELDESVTQQLALEEALAESKERLHECQAAFEINQSQRENLEAERLELADRLQQHNAQAQLGNDSLQQIRMRQQELTIQQQAVNENMQRAADQTQKMQERAEELIAQLAEQGDPVSDTRVELLKQLDAKVEIEAALSSSREAMQNIEQQLRDQDSQRMAYQAEVQKARDHVAELKIKAQDVYTKRDALSDALGDVDALQLLSTLPSNASEAGWQQQLYEVQAKISRLGAINLAAIEEFAQEEQRKAHLDAQNDELESALETLENAIRRIDRETRARFKETFDEVNAGVKALFPKLFGGGHAYLELTSDDLLETGVTIMARPPGKRNSTIHLLSGGEKALTAISLVFAIFQLNPAPFCMIDEVDAPLDDANCGRFAKMVAEMSEKVQFIFITHNKIAMEMAHQLLGVTMHEPGVSRLVTVDVERAIEMVTV